MRACLFYKLLLPFDTINSNEVPHPVSRTRPRSQVKVTDCIYWNMSSRVPEIAMQNDFIVETIRSFTGKFAAGQIKIAQVHQVLLCS